MERRWVSTGLEGRLRLSSHLTAQGEESVAVTNVLPEMQPRPAAERFGRYISRSALYPNRPSRSNTTVEIRRYHTYSQRGTWARINCCPRFETSPCSRAWLPFPSRCVEARPAPAAAMVVCGPREILSLKRVATADREPRHRLAPPPRRRARPTPDRARPPPRTRQPRDAHATLLQSPARIPCARTSAPTRRQWTKPLWYC